MDGAWRNNGIMELGDIKVPSRLNSRIPFKNHGFISGPPLSEPSPLLLLPHPTGSSIFTDVWSRE